MPFFGVPIRNGLPIGLGSVAGFGVQQFDPSQLFEGGTVAGAWYDPSDLSTMFTTDAGTTPVAMPGGGAAVSVGRILDKSGNGNHAIAFNNTTARPELRARVNLLTYSEEFQNWQNLNTVDVSDVAVAPNGSLTADLLYPSSSGTLRAIRIASSQPAGVYTSSIYAKSAGIQFLVFGDLNSNNMNAVWFDLVNGAVGTQAAGYTGSITSVGNGWYRCVVVNPNITPSFFYFGMSNVNGSTSVTANGTDGIYIWGADLRPANIGANVPAYQRIADANTYDTSGFPLYLRFDGIDDSMYTPANLNLSGTDKVAVFAGVRKLSDAVRQCVAEFGNLGTPTTGSWFINAPLNIAPEYLFASAGTAAASASYTNAAVAAPVTNVVNGSGNIGGDSAILRINGVQMATSATDQGTGNYGTHPLYIGSRNNSSLWFNGHLHSLIIAGSAVSAGNISATEQWVAGKTGIVIP